MKELRLSDEFLKVEEKETWSIKNDLEADWALDKIRDSKAEYSRFKMVVDAKIDQLMAAMEKQEKEMQREIEFFQSKLEEYFNTLDEKSVKETKTLRKYKLPSGTLKVKKGKWDFKYSKNDLLEHARAEGKKEYIKVKEDFDWAKFKKELEITENHNIINKLTGEILDIKGLSVEEKPAEFEVEV